MASERVDWLKTSIKENKIVYCTVAAITSGFTFYRLSKYFQQRKQDQQLKVFEQQSIAEKKVILHMSPCWDFSTPHPSPFVTKLMAFFAYHKIEYVIDTTMSQHFYTTKMPWITYKNEHKPDSNLIIEWFKSQSDFDNLDMDKHLSKDQLVQSVAYKSMIEDGLLQVMGYRRWFDKKNLAIYWPMLIGKMLNPLMASILLQTLKGQIDKNLWNLGIARFTEQQVYQKGEDLIETVVQAIGDKKYFFGETLSSLDITIYSMIGAMYQCCFVFTR